MSDDDQFGDAYALKSQDETKAFYRSWAETYDQEICVDNGYAQPKRCAEALLRHVDHSKLDEFKVLDAGCGTGLSGLALYEAGIRDLHGCDFSEEMLEKAKALNVYKTLEFADLTTPLAHIKSSIYNVVTAVGVFSFGHISADALDTILRVTKNNGLVIICINEPFWDEGSVASKIESLVDTSTIRMLEKHYGDHLPGHKVNGWVIVLQKL